MKKPWNRGRLGLKGNNTGVPPGSRRERVGVETGLGALRNMRLRPGQRPVQIYDDTVEIAMSEGMEVSRRLSYYDRGPVTVKDFAWMKQKFLQRRPGSRDRYYSHELLKADVKAWARATLSHVPGPDTSADIGLTASAAAESCEAWLNEHRWPVVVTRARMAIWLRELGFGVKRGRWNCGFKTLEDPEEEKEANYVDKTFSGEDDG